MPRNPRSDRDHWNERYRDRPWPEEPSPWLVTSTAHLPDPGTALDVAGGTGRNAMWLAERGWNVTIVDVSDVAIELANRHAARSGVTVDTVLMDLTTDPLPGGPWDLVLLFHYLDRNLFPEILRVLAPGGVLIGALATVENLERNPRPPRPYLLSARELPRLLDGYDVIAYEEGWQDDHHDARFVARKAV